MDETQLFDHDEQRLFELLNDAFESRSGASQTETAHKSESQGDIANLQGMLHCLDKLRDLADGIRMPGPTVSPDEAEQSTADDDESSTDRPRLGRYEILRKIGGGGMGIVFEARHPALEKSVALKLIRSGQFASQDEVRRFFTEARIAAQIQHPNIVPVHDVDQWRGEHFLTMDLVCGSDLAKVIRRDGPMEPRRAAEIIATVARAVEHLHQHKIIHRDLKPSNILLDETDTPHVTDFGLARVFEGDSQHTTTGTILGTANYMPPEQAAGRAKDVTPRSDVYSLGAILYEMLTGHAPFREENNLDTILQVLESTPEPLRKQNESIPADLETICLTCLEKEPQNRLESAERLADELEKFLRDEPTQIQTRSLWQRFRRWTRQEPALSYRLGVVAAGACIIQANYWLSEDEVLLRHHLETMTVVAGWVLTCLLCQWLMRRDSWERRMPYLWAVTDVIFLTTLLVLAPPTKSLGPILIGYPLLVVAAGLWFEVRLVWLMTGLCCLAYLLLNLLRNEPIAVQESTPDHYPFIYAVVLCGIGYIVAYQVERIRALSRYFERRRG